MEGVVRSRSGRSFTLIDTGGVTLDSHHSVADGPEGLRGFEAEILQQTQAAMDEASVFCLVVDGRDGLMPFDEHLASFVRRAGKPTLLVVNKVDGMEHEDTMLAEFHALGFPCWPFPPSTVTTSGRSKRKWWTCCLLKTPMPRRSRKTCCASPCLGVPTRANPRW